MKSRKKLILILACVIVLIVGTAAILVILTSGNGASAKEKYIRKIETAQKYVQEENWDDAIVAYMDAIELDEEDEDAYYTLAQIYVYKNRMDDAKDILLKGMDITKSSKLSDMYNKYFDSTSEKLKENETKEKSDKSDTPEINTTILKRISSYTLEQYIEKYGQADYKDKSDVCEVRHKSLKNFVFSYYNTDDNSTIIDSSTGQPKSNKMPWKVTCKDLKELFVGIDTDVITKSMIESMKLEDVEFKKDTGSSKYILRFKVDNCTVTIETDKDGSFKSDAWNEIEPKDANENQDEVFNVEACILSSTTGEGLGEAEVFVRARGNESGDYIASAVTGSDGKFNVELEQGEYTAELNRDHFISEYVDFTVDKWGQPDVAQFVMSQELAEGEIRIVLEWGEYPYDLDSHLIGHDVSGNDIHVSFHNKITDVAELDVDEMDSYGPETITVKDNGAGEYTYVVHDYGNTGELGTSGATVKVYMPGQSSPKTYTVPENINSYTWIVFSIKDGQIVDPILSENDL